MEINCALLVDDDPISNFISENVVGHCEQVKKIHCAESGSEALRYIKAHCADDQPTCCPNLILLDLNMPGMDGFEFLENFQKLSFSGKEAVKVVVLTSSTNASDIHRAAQYSVAGYINKPLTQERFNEVLSNICPD